LADFEAIINAGVFAIVLENIDENISKKIAEKFPSVLTIGIGAGQECDGQILVTHDVLGLSDYAPPFAKKYADLQDTITQAVAAYCQDVRHK
jgi:3-methyl-2-oxobutanoate hydroxymethyltransferase